MNKVYIQPQTKAESAQCEMLIAASILDADTGTQSITPSNDEYDGEFSVKTYTFGDDFAE